MALTGNSRDWWLLNASPDLRAQLAAAPALWPGPDRPDVPVRGVLLTDAEIHHVTGLTALRGTAGLKVYAAPAVSAVLTAARGALDRYEPWEWADSLADDGFVLAGGLVVTAHPVGTTAPEYVPPGRAGSDDRWVTAYRVEDLATGRVLVYAPRVDAWSPVLDELCAEADCVLLDGTYYAPRRGRPVRSGGGRSGRGVPPHLPVTGGRGSLAALARHPGVRRIYTHLDHSNPLLDPSSEARAQVGTAGVEIPPDGAEFIV
ncbi:MBL fold metallo-hydrolase [Streptomyces sp. NPDC026672]|uniref:MBL fold metallo-hydrolase n=1 Tax=unclassified Streptomyces TaxID=2593676 RepID=UPI0033D6F4ED